MAVALLVVLNTAVAGTWLRLVLPPFRPLELAAGHEQASFWTGICERSPLVAAAATGTPPLTAARIMVAAKAAFRFEDLADRKRVAGMTVGRSWGWCGNVCFGRPSS